MNIKFDTTALEIQSKAKQPSWLLMVAIYVIAAFGLTQISYYCIKFFPAFWLFQERYKNFYHISFFVIQNLLVLISVAYFLRTYRHALFGDYIFQFQSLKKIAQAGLLLSLPLVFYHLKDLTGCISAFQLFQLATDPAIPSKEAENVLVNAHFRAWKQMPYGTSALGIFLNTMTILMFAPLFEEIIFTGFIFNKLTLKIKMQIALIGTAILFSLAHLPVIGFHSYLGLLFISSILALISRLLSGSWLSACFVHVISNVAVLLPKWVISWLVFKMHVNH
jgi:membrane protease YdiL (CAAX protease family)